MLKFEPCLPTRRTEVPTGTDWLHEIKLDGYRMLVIRENERVRLITRGGYDWSKRYPGIVESALKNRQKHRPHGIYKLRVSSDSSKIARRVSTFTRRGAPEFCGSPRLSSEKEGAGWAGAPDWHPRSVRKGMHTAGPQVQPGLPGLPCAVV